jgi:divalent metal cation (Fe/Co/Zn/Cd) transporter
MVAIYINIAANAVLLVGKIIVIVLTSSLSVLASLVDAALDFLSTAIVWATASLVANQDQHKYPVGRRRLEPIGVLVFSVVMITSFVEVALQCVSRLNSGDHSIVQLTLPAIVIMASTVLIKFGCWLWCRFINNSSVQALAQVCFILSFAPLGSVLTDFEPRDNISPGLQDRCSVQYFQHYFPTRSVFVASWWLPIPLSFSASPFFHFEYKPHPRTTCSLTPTVGYYVKIWYLDAVGGLILSFYVIFNWSRTSAAHIRNLTGAAATADERNVLLYLTMRFAKTIKQIQSLQAYHAGDKLNVEVDIVLDEGMPLRDSHDLGESLQYVLESVPCVDRAFVHLDYSSYNLPGHMQQQE